LKKVYRAPLDWVESAATGAADVVVVNSHFTAGVYHRAFPNLPKPRVVYPAADFGSFTQPDWTPKARGPFVSLNRFERKKNVGLAIEALALLWGSLAPENRQGVRLIVAGASPPFPNLDPSVATSREPFCAHVGGYDATVPENVEVLAELQTLAAKLRVSHLVAFQPSVSDDERNKLLQDALCVVYTPANEHFGIVPIEAMYAGTPVLASASGGPLETVVDGVTGFLRDANDPAAFSAAMAQLVAEPALRRALGQAAHAHVVSRFGVRAFEEEMHGAVTEAHARRSTRPLAKVAALVALLVAATWAGHR
jgi:alpha-1,3/alpha-1,6-mannosyltransferase